MFEVIVATFGMGLGGIEKCGENKEMYRKGLGPSIYCDRVLFLVGWTVVGNG